MGLFNFTNIKLTSEAPRKASSTLVGGSYESNVLRYPLDIGNIDKGHYIVIHINVQEETSYKYNATNDLPAVLQNAKTQASFWSNLQGSANGASQIVRAGTNFITGAAGDFLPNIGSVNTANNIIKTASAGAQDLLKIFDKGKTPRTIKRTSDTIALYMPDTLSFINSQSYADLALGSSALSPILAGGKALSDTLKNGVNAKSVVQAIGNIAPYLVANLANKTDIGRAIFAAGMGMVQNPMLEMIYSSPAFRSFTFDFMLYPRSKKEAREVMRIIKKLQFHQAPEVSKSFNGYFLIPPSEFDIKFYYNGKENPNIDNISTCVLESVNVDYAPQGFSTYEVPGELSPSMGGTGTPVAIRLSLQFKETQIKTKADYESGAYTPDIPEGYSSLAEYDQVNGSELSLINR